MAKTKVRTRCKWCGEKLQRPGHQYSEGYCFILHEREIRSRSAPKISKVSDAYANGKLRSEFLHTNIEEKLMARQLRLATDTVLGLSDNGYKVPRSINVFIDGGIVWNQVMQEKPWAVIVLKDGKRKRKRFNNLYEAVSFHKKIHTRYPSSGVVSLSHSYDIPQRWRFTKEKLPKKYKWCPRCANFRIFRRAYPEQKFNTNVKVKKASGKYEWTERWLWVTECQLCGCTNRDPVMRRSNLPYDVRKIKRGVRRVKPRIRTERGKKQRRRKR